MKRESRALSERACPGEFDSLYSLELGITAPEEIDLEAIAFYKGAVVRREALTGCEARIIGADNKAIITVNETSSIQRQKFSIGHELGHWFKHRGKIGNLCSKSDLDQKNTKIPHKEIIANDFASELLIPSYLLTPVLLELPLKMDTVQQVSNSFQCSMMVALRKVIEIGSYMGFFAVYDSNLNRKYFQKSDSLPYEFFPPQVAPDGSFIHDLICSKSDSPKLDFIDGGVWCKTKDADDALVYEHAFYYHDDQFITLVWWENEEPIWQFIEKSET